MVAEDIALGNTDPRFMRLKVILVEKLDRMRCHERQTELASQISGSLNNGLLLWLTVALHFEIEGAGEDTFPGLGPLTGQFKITGDQRLADITEMRSGQCDQTVAAEFIKPLTLDFSPITPTIDQVSPGQQLAQLLITGTIPHQKEQAGSILRRIRIGDPDIGTGDRLDALAPRAGVELDETKKIAKISHGHGRHAIASSSLDGITDADDAVGD